MNFNDRSVKVPDVRALLVTGLNVVTVTNKLPANQIVKIYLDNSVNTELKERLITSVTSVLYSSNKFTEVFMFSGDQFELFCELAVQSNYVCDDGSESWIITNVLYTNHTGFNQSMVPKKSQGEFSKGCQYKKDCVYCLRIIHKEQDREPQKVEDIIIYIPDKEKV